MSRLQIVIAVGLFLIVGLFGWQSYLDKRAKETESNRTDQRGIGADKVPGLQKHMDDAKNAKKVPKAPAKKIEGAADKAPGVEGKAEGTNNKADTPKDKVDAPQQKTEAPKPTAGDTPKK